MLLPFVNSAHRGEEVYALLWLVGALSVALTPSVAIVALDRVSWASNLSWSSYCAAFLGLSAPGLLFQSLSPSVSIMGWLFFGTFWSRNAGVMRFEDGFAFIALYAAIAVLAYTFVRKRRVPAITVAFLMGVSLFGFLLSRVFGVVRY